MSSTSPERQGTGARTRVIAHRGASGYLPEHTAAAKVFAYALGADFIEQDVVATKDRQLVVLHDIELDAISDVASVFPGRQREDGFHYVVDFTLEELRRISLHERRRSGSDELMYPGRFPYDLPAFRVQTLDEEIRLVSGLNASTGGHVGIYPEIKDPAWHAEADIDLTLLVHETLERARSTISGPVFVQSFSTTSLRRMRTEFDTAWPLVQLIDADRADALATGDEPVAAIADYAQGVGLPYTALLTMRDGRLGAAPLATMLRTAGLEIHPYTLRRDAQPAGDINYFDALGFLIHELQVEAVFCDFPDDAIAVRAGSGA